MAFTLQVDDGTTVDANAVIDAAFFKAYHIDRGQFASGDFSDGEIQQAILLATDYVDNRWRKRFLGIKKGADQGTEFPRTGFVDRNGHDLSDLLPQQLKQGVAEYALRALTSPLAPDPETSDTGMLLTTTRDKVGPIEELREFQAVGDVQTFKPYPIADAMIKTLLGPSGRHDRI